jgi:hypothetical protein
MGVQISISVSIFNTVIHLIGALINSTWPLVRSRERRYITYVVATLPVDRNNPINGYRNRKLLQIGSRSFHF